MIRWRRGVAANKQGFLMKGYVEDAIKEAIGDEVTTINDEIKRFQAAQAAARPDAAPRPCSIASRRRT